jgi:flagellar basal-body rod modification protein FlgD
VKVQITNSSGQVVGSIDLGAQSAGTVPVKWTPDDSAGNALPDGNYTITATATNGTSSVTATPLVASTVEGVIQESGGAAGLSLANGNTVALSSVGGIL